MLNESNFINRDPKNDGFEKQEISPAEANELVKNSLNEVDQKINQLEDASELEQRLLALGKNGDYIQEVSKKFFDTEAYKRLNDQAYKLDGSILFHLGNMYHRYVSDIDQSIIAELKLRPIEKKFKQLKKKFKEEGFDLAYAVRDRELEDAFVEHEYLVHDYISNNDLVDDIYTLQENIPKRKLENISVDHFIDGLDIGLVEHGSTYIRDQKALNLFYSFALHEIGGRNTSSHKSEDLIKAYLSPSPLINVVDHHTTKNLYHKKYIEESPLRVTHPILERAEKLNEVMSKPDYVITDEIRSVLRESLVNVLENSTYDFAQHPNSVSSLLGLIDKADFEDSQKERIYDHLMEIPARLGYMDAAIELMTKGGLLSNPKYVEKFFKNFKYLDKPGEYRFGILLDVCKQLSAHIDQEHLKYIQEEYNRSIDQYVEKQSNTSKTLEFIKKQEELLSGEVIPKTDVQNALSRLTEKLKAIFREDFSDEYLELLVGQRKELDDVPEQYISRQEKEAIINNGVWSESITTMLNLYKPSRRTAYDVWYTEMAPLVNEKNKEGEISFKNPKDGELVLDYVKKIGPINLPLYFTLFKNIKGSPSVKEMDQTLKQEILENFNVNVDVLCASDPTNIDLIISEIEKYRHKVRVEFSNENIEFIKKVIDTKYGEEFIASVKGSSGFGQVEIKDVIDVYARAINKKSEKFEVDPAYEKVGIEVGEYSADSIQQDNSQEIEKVLNNSELKIAYARISETMNLNIGDAGVLKELNKKIEVEFDNKINNFKENIIRQKAADNPNEQAIQNMERMENAMEEMKKNFQNIIIKDNFDSVDLLNQYFHSIPDKFNSKADLFRYLTINDFQKRFPDQFPNVRNIQSGEPNEVGVTTVVAFLRDHIGEHYLNKKHGHGPESAISIEDKNILRYLRKTWGVNDFDNNILSVSDKKINQLSRGELVGKKRNITMIPSKGLLRIFSGDLGGACTSNRAQELAAGKYEGITAYALVINKGQNNERFGGSFLVVETETKDKQPMLVLRANNPSQSLVQTVDTDSLIENVISEVKNIAKRKGIKHVGVVRDNASQACSNRTEVSEYYKKNFADNIKVELKKTDDTTFNGYDIHNSKGSHPVVLL